MVLTKKKTTQTNKRSCYERLICLLFCHLDRIKTHCTISKGKLPSYWSFFFSIWFYLFWFLRCRRTSENQFTVKTTAHFFRLQFILDRGILSSQILWREKMIYGETEKYCNFTFDRIVHIIQCIQSHLHTLLATNCYQIIGI